MTTKPIHRALVKVPYGVTRGAVPAGREKSLQALFYLRRSIMENNFCDSLCRPVRKLRVLAELFDGVGCDGDLYLLLKLITKNEHTISYGVAEHLEDIVKEINEIGQAFSHVWIDGVQGEEVRDLKG